MAIFKLGAMFDAISGKVGGQSLCNYSQQQILKNITYTNASPTIKQSKQRALTAALSNSWRFLTSAQRAGWSSTALNYTYVNRVGDTITRNGYQTFCFVNQNLSLIGGTLLDAAPLYVPVSEPKINITDISSGNFEIQSNNASSDYYYALFGIANLSSGQAPQTGMMRFLGYITAAQLTAGYDVVSDLENVFGALSFPNNIGIIVDPINNTTGNRKQFVDIIQNIDTPMILELTVSDGDTVTIPFGSGGVYSGSIDFGDGTVNTFSAFNSAGCTHTYTLGGVYRVLIFGVFPKFQVTNAAFKAYLTDVIQFGSNAFTAINFYGCTKLINIGLIDTPNLSNSTQIRECFRSCTNLVSIQNIESWDVSQVTSIDGIFRSCNKFNGDLSSWSILSAVNFQRAFENNDALTSDLTSLVTSSATNLNNMFVGALLFNGDVTTWNVSNVTNFSGIFSSCAAFNQNLASWDISSATNMTNFANASGWSNANWDSTLIGWAALPTPPSGITISVKPVHTAAAAAAYTTLTTTYGWSINEGV